MKEQRFFYAPEPELCILPEEETDHASKVLRLKEGDTINVIDGKGNMYLCDITKVERRKCLFRINATKHFAKQWSRPVHIAMAPTKNIDRTEWFVEKATEIGVDQFDFLDCKFSERRNIKTERLERIVVSAMKQSHKFYKPIVTAMQSFMDLAATPFQGIRCIAHCYDEVEMQSPDYGKPFLSDLLSQFDGPMQIFIGPEGDFSKEEVDFALKHNFIPVSLGESRLRTETAAIVAVHLMQLASRQPCDAKI